MQLTASQFAAVDTAYRQERITASFRDQVASHDVLQPPAPMVRRDDGGAYPRDPDGLSGRPGTSPPAGRALSLVPAMMGDVPPATDIRGPLVGRAVELDRLVGLVGVGQEEPAGSAVLVSGDAGVGKTRILAELRDRAEAEGWRVLVGHCLDFGDSALPYLPFSEAFGRLAAESPVVARTLVEAAPVIARLMPARRVLPEQSTGAEAEPADATTIDRPELFAAVHGALEQLGRSAPLLLVVEDVHWADRSTREMLSFLFSRRFDSPVAVVASYRSDDLHRRHPLRTTAAEWSRLPGVTRLDLGRLGDADVRELVHSLHPAPMSERALHGIVERAEGNAFFTEELVQAAEVGPDAIPEALADLLLVRLDRLDDDARLVVRAAAVSGRRVPHLLLERVLERSGRVPRRGAAGRGRGQRAGADGRRRLRVPPRAARRGGLRRPAARRAGPAARGVRRGAAAGRGRRHRGRAGPARQAGQRPGRPPPGPASRPATRR